MVDTTEDKVDNCVFCARTGEILFDHEDFYFRLDDSPIVEGHGLLITESHYPSFADISPSMSTSLKSVLDQVRSLYRATYGECLFFEHGRTASCITRNPEERFCHHAHIHVVPYCFDIMREIQQSLPMQSLSAISELQARADKLREGYLLTLDCKGKTSVYPVVRSIGSHFLRKLLANHVGSPEYADWSRIVDSDRSRQLKEKASSRLLSQIKDFQE